VGDEVSGSTSCDGLGAPVVAAAAAALPPPRAPLGEIANRGGAAADVGGKAANGEAMSSHPQDLVGQDAALEYADDMLRQMLRRETHYMPGVDYLQWQVQGDGQMRAILNDWLVEVIRAHGFRRETLFLTVSLIDRYLALARVAPSQLLLVGATAMLIASKFEEVKPPEVGDLVQYTASACSKREIVSMEMSMLVSLSFEITCPTAAHFLLHFRALEEKKPAADPSHEDRRQRLSSTSAKDQGKAQDDLAWRALELTLLDEQMLRHPPSHLAAGALLLANRLSGRPRPHWPPRLARLCQLSEEALGPCVAELRGLLEADNCQAPAEEHGDPASHSQPSRPSAGAAATSCAAPGKVAARSKASAAFRGGG
jgi:cyclin B